MGEDTTGTKWEEAQDAVNILQSQDSPRSKDLSIPQRPQYQAWETQLSHVGATHLEKEESQDHTSKGNPGSLTVLGGFSPYSQINLENSHVVQKKKRGCICL